MSPEAFNHVVTAVLCKLDSCRIAVLHRTCSKACRLKQVKAASANMQKANICCVQLATWGMLMIAAPV